MSNLVLASQSPRRTQLLEKAGFLFTSLPISTSELIDKKLNPEGQILSITRQKLEAAEKSLSQASKGDSTVIVSDTEVIFEGELLGKPRNTEHSREILRRLSGNFHFVKTGFIVKNLETQIEVSHIETSFVQFRTLDQSEIRAYVASGDGMDKAGAYGIQGFGHTLVQHQRGSFSNIVGLPIEVLTLVLKKYFHIPAKVYLSCLE